MSGRTDYEFGGSVRPPSRVRVRGYAPTCKTSSATGALGKLFFCKINIFFFLSAPRDKYVTQSHTRCIWIYIYTTYIYIYIVTVNLENKIYDVRPPVCFHGVHTYVYYKSLETRVCSRVFNALRTRRHRNVPIL